MRSRSPHPQKFVFKEPTKQLRRGKACLNCRFHKIKCDGVKPVCGPCTRLPRAEECEYSNGPSRTRRLEQRVTRLKARVRELEDPDAAGHLGMQLQDPYTLPDEFSTGVSGQSVSVNRSDSDYSRSSSPSTNYDPLLGSSKPSASMNTMLIDIVLPYAFQLGFFLHIERFKAAALLDASFGGSSRPSPALLDATYLWGAYLSAVDASPANETVFLKRALQQVSIEIPTAIRSDQIMHTIQAEVLLSTYFFRKNQLLEAEFHLNGAVSLVQSAGLHQLRSDRVFNSPVVSVQLETEMFLPPARDMIEEGERINGFWTVFCLHRLISVALGNPSRCFGGLDNPCMDIDTPWPQEYEFGLYNNGLLGRSTINQFFYDTSPCLKPVFDLSSHVKAVILLHCSVGLAQQIRRGLGPDESEAFMNKCLVLESVITRLYSSLPPVDMEAQHGHTTTPLFPLSLKSALTLTRVMVSCAYLQVQKIFLTWGLAGAIERYIGTAQCVIRTLGDVNQLGLPHLDQMVGILCAMACSAFGDELSRVDFPDNWDLYDLGVVPAPRSSVDAGVLRQGLEAGMTTMSVLAMNSPLLKYQMTKLQNLYPFIYSTP